MKLRRMVEDKKCCGMRYAVCAAFFHPTEWNRQRIAIIERCRIAHRTTQQGGDAGPPRLKTFHSVWITGSMNEVKKKGGEKKEEQGKTERKRERERKKVHTRTHTLSTLRDLGNGKWERGEEIMISKRYRVPYVPPKDYPLNLGLISGEEKKEKEKRKKNDTMIRIIAMIDDVWLTVEQRAGSGIRI